VDVAPRVERAALPQGITETVAPGDRTVEVLERLLVAGEHVQDVRPAMEQPGQHPGRRQGDGLVEPEQAVAGAPCEGQDDAQGAEDVGLTDGVDASGIAQGREAVGHGLGRQAAVPEHDGCRLVGDGAIVRIARFGKDARGQVEGPVGLG
jgi:hypothetical protein